MGWSPHERINVSPGSRLAVTRICLWSLFHKLSLALPFFLHDLKQQKALTRSRTMSQNGPLFFINYVVFGILLQPTEN
jgi:hypothetical protein